MFYLFKFGTKLLIKKLFFKIKKNMFKVQLLIIFALFFICSYGQKLNCDSKGNIYDENGNKYTPENVRYAISSSEAALNLYNSGRDKKSIGNFLMIMGAGFMVGDLVNGALRDVQYPTAHTTIGFSSLVLAVPIKLGFSKKIKRSLEIYNDTLKGNTSIEVNDFQLVFNEQGLGIKFSLD